ncbi:MAG TPA: Crp/Fnr family transcriptional regulator [Eubacteriaceae bacterium]|nr:Crp/Fnr family transcriptional regulator [Eubacteriaceae bacterium]
MTLVRCCMHQNDYCVKKVPIFSNLSDEEMCEIYKTIIHKDYKKGEIIYFVGDIIENLYIINKGKVKVTKISENGKEQIIRILSEGDFIEELSIITKSVSTNNVEALEDTTMCIVNGPSIKKIIDKKPSIAFKIMEELGKRLEKTEKLMESIGLYSVEKRIAQILLEMADKKDIVNLTISKKDLASYIGMSQETLSRKLSQFQSKGWIELKGHRKIIIKNRESLKNIFINFE